MMFGKDELQNILDKVKAFGLSKEELGHLLVAMVEAAARGFGEGVAKELSEKIGDHNDD